jgi:FSR family fosmidomycin resistance protein-like MFS transporter
MIALKKFTARSRVKFATSMAHFVNDVSTALLPAVIVVLKDEFNLSYTAEGALITSSVLLMTALQAVTGYVADRRSRVTLLCLGLTTLGMGTTLIAFATDYIQLLVFAFLAGIGGSFFHPIGYSLLSDAFESENRGKALGLGSASGDIAIPVAFATSGIVILFIGWRPIFMFWGAIAIVAAVMLPLIMREPKKTDVHLNVADNSTAKTLWTLIPVITVMGLTAACFRIASTFTTTYLKTLGLGIESANFVFALMMCVGAVGSLFGGTLIEKLGEKKTVIAGMVMLGVLSIVSIYINNVYFTPFIIVIMGFFLLGVWPSFYSLIANATNLGARAFTYGLTFAVAWSFGSFWPFLSGVCADIFGIQVIYILIGGLSLLGALTAYFTFKK